MIDNPKQSRLFHEKEKNKPGYKRKIFFSSFRRRLSKLWFEWVGDIHPILRIKPHIFDIALGLFVFVLFVGAFVFFLEWGWGIWAFIPSIIFIVIVFQVIFLLEEKYHYIKDNWKSILKTIKTISIFIIILLIFFLLLVYASP